MKIVLIGAYGYTGKLICKEFENHGIAFSIAGKDEAKLIELRSHNPQIDNYFVSDIRKTKDIDTLLNYADLIVNCAGPFTEESSLFLEKVASSGKNYLDITGELGFVKNSKEKLHSKAVESNSLILHSVAFESLIIDLVLQVMTSKEEKSEIKVYYKFNQNRISPGTRITMKLSNYRDSLYIKDGQWTKMDGSENFERFHLDNEDFGAIPYPLPEIAFAYWNYTPKEVNTFLLLPWQEAKFIQPLSVPKDGIEEMLERLKKLKKEGPTEDERACQNCHIIVRVGDLVWRVHTSDMYQLTAKCIRILAYKIENNATFSGVLNPALLFKGEELNVLNLLDVTISKKKLSAN